MNIFLISPEKNIVGTYQKCLVEAFLMNTRNICSHGEITKKISTIFGERTSPYLELRLTFGFL